MSDVADGPATSSSDLPAEVSVDQGPTPQTAPIPSSRVSRAIPSTAVGLVLLVVVIVFVVENRTSVRVEFFGATWHLPLAIDLLLAAVLGAVVTLTLGTARIIQLRRVVRRQAVSSARRHRHPA